MFSLTFYLSLVLYTGVAIPLLGLIVAAQAPFISHQKAMRRFRRMITWYGYGIIKGLARPAVRIVYETPAPDLSSAKIFIANHISAADPFLVALLPEAVVQVVKRWPLKLPVWGHFARWAGYLDIRGMTTDAFQVKAAHLLSNGISIVAFPEGTRAGDQDMGPFHSIMFRLALTTRTPLVPLCITGNERTPARSSILLEPTTIRVRRLPEIPWQSFQDQTPFRLKNQVRQLIQQEVNHMRGQP